MQPGLLDRTLVLQEPVGAPNSIGEEIVTWTTRATVKATIKPVRGREALTAQQPLAQMDTRIFIYDSTATDVLNEKWRGVCTTPAGEVLYNFVSVNRLGRRAGIEIMATSGANHG
jgi:head-tail adaptor